MFEEMKSKIPQMTDAELKEIYANAADYQVAYIDLIEREMAHRKTPGYEDLKLYNKKVETGNDLAIEEGKKGTTAWLTIYFLSALLGGIIGIIAGYNYAFSKTENSKGEKFYTYDAETRKYGAGIFFLGIALLIAFYYWKFEK